MPQYIDRVPSDIKATFHCVFCSNPYASKAGLKRHMSSCPDNDDIEADFDDIEVDEGVTVSDSIHWQEELNRFIKELAVSKELSQFQSQSPDEIRSHIHLVLYQRQWTKGFPENVRRRVYEVYMIYELFFGLTEDDKRKRNEELLEQMKGWDIF